MSCTNRQRNLWWGRGHFLLLFIKYKRMNILLFKSPFFDSRPYFKSNEMNICTVLCLFFMFLSLDYIQWKYSRVFFGSVWIQSSSIRAALEDETFLFFVVMENCPLKVAQPKLRVLQNQERHFQVIGHPAEFGWKHIPYVLRLIVGSSCRLLQFLSYCRCHTVKAPFWLCLASMCVCVHLFLCLITYLQCVDLFVCPLNGFRCLLNSPHVLWTSG